MEITDIVFFAQLWQKGVIGYNNFIYDKEAQEIKRVKEMDALLEQLSVALAQEGNHNEAEGAKAPLEKLWTTEKDPGGHFLSSLLCVSACFIAIFGWMLHYLTEYTWQREDFIRFLLQPLSWGMLITVVCMGIVCGVLRHFKQRKLLFLFSCFLVMVAAYQTLNTFVEYAELQAMEQQTMAYLHTMQDLEFTKLSLQTLPSEARAYSPYFETLTLSQKFFESLQRDWMHLYAIQTKIYRADRFMPHAYASENVLRSEREALDEIVKELYQIERNLVLNQAFWSKNFAFIAPSNQRQKQILQLFDRKVGEAYQKVFIAFGEIEESSRKIEQMLEFMQKKQQQYVVTRVGVRFLRELDREAYRTMLNNFYSAKSQVTSLIRPNS